MKYHFRVHKEKDGFWCECIELRGCYTQADSLSELKANAGEALDLYLSEPENSKEIFPFPDLTISVSSSVIKVPVDPQVALAFSLRMLRLKRNWTKSDVSRKLKFVSVSAYNKLECHKANPTLETIKKLINVFPELANIRIFS